MARFYAEILTVSDAPIYRPYAEDGVVIPSTEHALAMDLEHAASIVENASCDRRNIETVETLRELAQACHAAARHPHSRLARWRARRRAARRATASPSTWA